MNAFVSGQDENVANLFLVMFLHGYFFVSRCMPVYYQITLQIVFVFFGRNIII